MRGHDNKLPDRSSGTQSGTQNGGTQNRLLWVWNLLMAGVIVALLSCCAKTPIIVADMPMLARTICSLNGIPVIVLNQHLTGDDVIFAIAHERVHVKQMGRDCDKVISRYTNDPVFQVAMELEAYCADRQERLKRGQHPDSTMQGIKEILARMHGADTSGMSCRPP
jgi:hypothetical protein